MILALTRDRDISYGRQLTLCCAFPLHLLVSVSASHTTQTQGCEPLQQADTLQVGQPFEHSSSAWHGALTLCTGGYVEAVAIACKDALRHFQYGCLYLVKHSISVLVNNLRNKIRCMLEFTWRHVLPNVSCASAA